MVCLLYLHSRTYAERVVTEAFSKMYFYVINTQNACSRVFPILSFLSNLIFQENFKVQY